ncbi:MAG TPA: PD-(D/E)XK nuclease family protein [Silvibacterium sp.]|nr:PD-(D/E)XK nuclease family protein [Silvibacterium sp.]
MPVSDEIKEAFASGATILTANARAARWLRREYALEQRRAGRSAWASPPIEDWETWVRGRWEMSAVADPDAPLLLTSLQERSVWTRMQREDAGLVVSAESMAALAESAYTLLSDYECHSERKHAWGKTDAESFRRWAANFDRECARWKWIPGAELELRVAASLSKETLPEEILLLGFDRMTRAQESLHRALVGCGVRVRFAEAAFSGTSAEFVRAAGMQEEIEACAWRVRALIADDPDSRIGVLVPDLGAMRSEIERIFRRVLMPRSDDVFSDQEMPFEFSLGQPLASVPVIRAALLLLRWLREPLREEEISWLLLSGYLSPQRDEYVSLAKFDARIRSSASLLNEIAFGEFLKLAAGVGSQTIRNLANALRAAAANGIANERRLPGRWVDLAQSLLRDGGWPGAPGRDTMHFQALRRWERALDEIALLDFDGRQMSYEEFGKALDGHARETIFSPESQGAPVQIMGPREASGQQFDALWFLSADDASWPQSGRLHPLLPADVQRRFNMPHSSAKADLELAKLMTGRIAASAPVVTFSYSERGTDGENRPSPVLPRDAEWRSASALTEVVEQRARELEEFAEASGNIAWPQERSPGGSEVLKSQAVCPFQAFATKRLRAEALDRKDRGLSAAERGVLLHAALERIWSPSDGALHSLGDLRSAIREERLRDIVRSAIAEAFAGYRDLEGVWARGYLAREKQRLQTRLEEWLRLEASRAQFEVIGCEEELKDVIVGGLKLKLRADRIDQVADFDRLLIDYKSGEAAPRDWRPPRPNEPQLPLYAVFGNVENVRGVLFARIRAGDTCFSGSVANVRSQLLPDASAHSALAKEPYTDSLRDVWEEALLDLAGEFLRGEAAVDPKEGRTTCRYCPLPGLCRVAETRDPLAADGEEDGDGD